MHKPDKNNGWINRRIYCNRHDPRVIVKRTTGLNSYTMNLGNKWTWIFNALVLVLFILLLNVLL